MKKAVVFFAVGCGILASVSCEQPSMIDSETGEVNGEKVYQYYCTSCHGPKGDRGAGQAPDLTQSKIGDDAIRQMILYGSDKGMAAYQSLISEEELPALVEYVKSLRN